MRHEFLKGLLGKQYVTPMQGILGGMGEGVAALPRGASWGSLIGAMGGGIARGRQSAQMQNNAQMQMMDVQNKFIASQAAAKRAELGREAIGKLGSGMNFPEHLPEDVVIELIKAGKNPFGGSTEGRMLEYFNNGPSDPNYDLAVQYLSRDRFINTPNGLMKIPALLSDKGGNGAFVPGTTPAEIAEKLEEVRRASDIAKNLPKTRARIRSALVDQNTMRVAIQEAIDLVASATTGGIIQSVLEGVPGSDAYILNSKLDTIKAIIGFDRLLQIKAAGGTLGALSEMENKMLQAVQGAIDARLEGKDLTGPLNRILNTLNANVDYMQEEFLKNYPDETAPTLMPQVGDIVDGYKFRGGDPTNPDSWEKI